MANCDTNMYMIGSNEYEQLGLKHQPHGLVKWNDIHPDIIIKNINNGYVHTVFTDKHNNYFIANKENFTSGKYGFSKCYESAYCKINNIKIKKICTNVAFDQRHTFWITNHNMLLNTKPKPEQNATNIQLLNNIIDIADGESYRLVLCGSSLNLKQVSFLIRSVFLKNKYLSNDIIGIITEYYIIENTVYTYEPTYDYLFLCNTLKSIKQIRCGYSHGLCLSKHGTVYAFGSNHYGQIGSKNLDLEIGFNNREIMTMDFFVSNKIFIIEIQCGSHHNLCMDSHHKVYAFGANAWGQCGIRKRSDIYCPQLIQSLSKYFAVSIKCGSFHSYVKTLQKEQCKHYLFGSNQYNECSLEVNKESRVLVPNNINDIFSKKTNAEIIIDIFLGYKCTFIISKKDNQN
eukprot:330095_1